MNPLNRQWFYRGFRKRLAASLGKAAADKLWKEAGKEYSRILAFQPELKRHKPVRTGCGSTRRKSKKGKCMWRTG